MLAQALQHDVPHLTRVKGVDYFRRGAVLSVIASDRGALAVVRGTRDYQVTIEHESGGFAATCECPYFTDRGEICKHIWAVVVAPDTESILAANGPLPRRAWIDAAIAPEDGDHPGEVPEAPFEAWQHFLGEVRRGIAPADFDVRPSVGQIVYVIDVPGSRSSDAARVSIMSRSRRRDSEWGRPKPLSLSARDLKRVGDDVDREVFSLLRGGESPQYGSYPTFAESLTYQLDADLQRRVLPLMVGTGRALLAPARDGALLSLSLDEKDEWRFELQVVRQSASGGYSVDGVLRRGDARLAVSELELVLKGGFLFTRSTMARLRIDSQLSWLLQLRHAGSIVVPATGAASLVETLARSGADPGPLPEELRYEVESGVPRPAVLIRRQTHTFAYGRENLLASVSFEYSGTVTGGSEPTAFDAARRRLVLRDSAAEQAAFDRLAELGFRKQWNPAEGRQALGIPADRFPAAVRTLVTDGWRVEAEGRLFRAPRDTQLEVRSGIDWFELHGRVDFGDGMSASLPDLLTALQRGDGTLLLEDGTRGLVPEEWLRRVEGAARYGQTEDDHVRYRASQAALLDALLASQPAVALDEVFARARTALENFAGVGPLDPPSTFQGHLREYQREALGWLEFLRRFGFGGCLADDMGLGKTVMVLAMLEGRRSSATREDHRPSLVVVPRSLVFNWMEEARRFAPGMRVLDYTGTERSTEAVNEHDLVLTTYGTLRRDAAQLKAVEFDYVILDEAQAIKNATTASAKAARLLRGRHRLALSGTPIENHIGELWSLFDFLNPGLLGTAATFQRTAGRTRLDPDELALVARAVRPFILRRTKAQVAPELPERSEQTIHCELDTAQRKHYDDLRTHYRRTLFAYVDRHGMAKSRLQVLEALLRLRQAACHPGLVDPKRASEPSAKFDVLLPQLQEVVEEGHKALVFSQFTSLLALLRPQLDTLGLKYEYLDGKTRDRAERVEHFQTDPDCPLFLISLKAGGLGLNLTAAEYVFLLDPWWNPAAEAQAIDRAHRIGQTRHVIAYRLIAKDTVEEKVAALQETKRELADAILAADAGLVRSLSREDLEWLVT